MLSAEIFTQNAKTWGLKFLYIKWIQVMITEDTDETLIMQK